MSDKVLAENERKSALAELAGWTYDEAGKAISRKFKFSGFSEAFGFMTRVALLAAEADHHPDWSNAYDTVEITLSTHSAGGLTQKDIDLAKGIGKLLG